MTNNDEKRQSAGQSWSEDQCADAAMIKEYAALHEQSQPAPDRSELVERLRGFVKAYEDELSEDPYGRGLIEEAIAALSAPIDGEAGEAQRRLGGGTGNE